MNEHQKGIATLIKSAINECPYTLPENFDVIQTAKDALRHKIMGLVYYGAVYCGVDKKQEAMKKLFSYVIPAMNICEKQLFELRKICAAFEENGIDYMLLKGTVLQKYFPAVEMRLMGDADILIRTEQYDKIETIMRQLGFEFSYESDHELVWKNKNLFLELHKRLIPSYNRDYAGYYGDGWKLAKVADGHSYAMTNEDQMVYLFTHFAKHYRDGGIGIRHLVDLYIFAKANPDMDQVYVETELKKLRLLDFYKNIYKTLAVWFDNAESDMVTDLITDVIFGSGAFGTSEGRLAAGGLREMSDGKSASQMRNTRLWKLLFLPYADMCETYPVLKKWKILLPVMWVVRAFKVVLFKQDQLKKTRSDFKMMSNDRINTYERALKAVGLSFEFKE